VRSLSYKYIVLKEDFIILYTKIEKQFNRTRISINDLDQAIKYLKYLNQNTINSDYIIRSALLTAAIISYSRPFSDNV